jgi:hypothetical protein
MGVWQGVAMDSIKFHLGLLCPIFLCLGPTAISGVACLQGRWPAAIFYPLGHPTPYAYVKDNVKISLPKIIKGIEKKQMLLA